MAAAKKVSRYKVTGPAVVLPTVGGSERYLYRGAVVDAKAFTEAGIKHGVELGLLTPIKGDVPAKADAAAEDDASSDGESAESSEPNEPSK